MTPCPWPVPARAPRPEHPSGEQKGERVPVHWGGVELCGVSLVDQLGERQEDRPDSTLLLTPCHPSSHDWGLRWLSPGAFPGGAGGGCPWVPGTRVWVACPPHNWPPGVLNHNRDGHHQPRGGGRGSRQRQHRPPGREAALQCQLMPLGGLVPRQEGIHPAQKQERKGRNLWEG